ncbi:MAG: phosphate ABC transporter substrate-binding protein PstS [Thermoplasmata archaeon]|nr:phosphate ABC transporter substrate-binding protein PstS [Thermoplasmata archaeon]
MSGSLSGSPDAVAGESPPSPPPPVVRRKSSSMGLIAVIAVIVIVAAGLGLAYEQHWIGPKAATAGICGPVTLQGDGAQIATPLVLTWAAAYAAQTGNAVNYPGAGSGTGITHFTSPSIDFGIADNPLSAAQTQALPSPALTLPVTGSAITIAYNLPNVASSVHLNLTGPILAAIWLGTITNWNSAAIQAINPGVTLPNATIKTVDRAGSAGTTYVFTDYLSQENATWSSLVGKGLSVKFPAAPSQTAQSSNSALLSLVNSTADTIGYSDLTDVLTLNTHSLGYASIENPSGKFVTPTLADTATALADKVASMSHIPAATASWYNVSMVNANGTGDYPLATFIYLYVYQATNKGFAPTLEKSEVLVQWITWVISTTEGQTYVSAPNLYYPALPAPILSNDATGIGTMNYNGGSIPSC